MPWSNVYLKPTDAAWKNNSLSPKIKEIIISISNAPIIKINLIFQSGLDLYNFSKKNSLLTMNKTHSHQLQFETADRDLIRCLFYATNDLDLKFQDTSEIADFINIDLSPHAEEVLAFIQNNTGDFDNIFTFAKHSPDREILWHLSQHCDTKLADFKKAIRCYHAISKNNPHFQAANHRILEILAIILNSEQKMHLSEDEIKNYLDLQFKCKLNLVVNEKTQQDFDQYYQELSGGLSGSPPCIQNVGPNPQTLMKLAEIIKNSNSNNIALQQELASSQLYAKVLEIQISELAAQLSQLSFNGSTYQRFAAANLIDPKGSRPEQLNPSISTTDVIITINETEEREVTLEPEMTQNPSMGGFTT
jgi:hypothetical protein